TDALVSQFVVGEIENSVVQAFRNERPDIILVEGQSAISHPAFMSSIGILKGSMPDGVILQHPPARKFRCDFPALPMPTPESEIKLIETISKTKVIAIALSHEDMNKKEVLEVIENYEHQLKLPTTDVLSNGCQKLVQALSDQFPKLEQKIKLENSKFFLNKQIKGGNRLEGIDEFVHA
ncbi:MAG: putative NAD-dependent epimerase/dehydratase family protein, partial [Nitrospinales bacterium]